MEPNSNGYFVCDLCGTFTVTKHGLQKHRESKKCKIQQTQPSKSSQQTQSNEKVYINGKNNEDSDSSLFDILKNSRQKIKVLNRIPKGARRSAALKFSEIVDECVEENSVSSWKKLLLFSYSALKLPERNEAKPGNLTSKVRQNIADSSNCGGLLTSQNPVPTSNENKIKKIIESKINDGDIKGAVRILSSQDSVAPKSEHILKLLLEKHPAQQLSADFPILAESPLHIPDVSPKEVWEAIRSFPNGSSGGFDGLRPQHLKDMLKGISEKDQDSLLLSLSKLITLLVQGLLPETVSAVLYGASLTALTKPDGNIRPIAVGNVVRRMAGKIVSKRLMHGMGNMLRPRQMGYGTSNGAEIVVHATRQFLEDQSNEDQILLKLDFKNAFNEIYRDRLLREVEQYFPEYLPFIHQLYRLPSILNYQGESILSARGVQQGDPLGPLLFCVTIQKLITSLKSPLNLWYLDDGTIGGSLTTVLEDLETIIREGSKLGLMLNLAKCEVFIKCGDLSRKEDLRQIIVEKFPDISFPSESTITLLGSPLLPEGVPGSIENKIDKIDILVRRLNILHAHHGFYLLKNCLSIPKLIYLLRTCKAWEYGATELARFDSMLRQGLETVLNVKLDATSWRQATLPVSLGGLGVRRTEEIALPAFLASIHSVAVLVSQIYPSFSLKITSESSLNKWRELTDNTEQMPTTNLQRDWDKPILLRIYSVILSGVNLRDKARLLSLSRKESGAWLQAMPIASVGCFLDNVSLRIAIGLRLGVDICVPHICRCGVLVDSKGHHGLSCVKSGGRYSRHNDLNLTLKRALGSCHIPSVLEPSGLFRLDGKRPDGMTLLPWKKGKPLVWDVTCVDTLAKSNIVHSIEGPGEAAKRAEENKLKKYSEISENFNFVPFAVETFGSFGPRALELFNSLSRSLVLETGDRRAGEYFRQRLAVSIVRGNVASVLSTLPREEEWKEFYILF